MKKCNVCGNEFPATTEYFYREKRTKDGLRAKCKTCFLDESARLSKNRVYTKEQRERQKKYIEDNKDKYKRIWKQYKQRNQEKIAKQKQQYYQRNKDRLTENIRKYQKAHKDEILLRNGIYKRIRYTDEIKNYTIDEWIECKNYFDNKCAYCGKQRKLEKEHFIPFKYGGEYSRQNIVPSCKSCNVSKYDKNFSDWYPLQKFYSKQREDKILRYLGYKNNTQQLSIL